MDNIRNLIFGKGTIDKIVSIEPGDEQVEIFTENEHGEVSSQFVPNAYFILSNYPLNPKAQVLKGDLHYKYGYKYTTRESYVKAKSYYRDKDIYTVYNPKENFMIRTGHTYFKGMKHTEPSILSFDIETNGLKMDGNSKVYMISNSFRKNGKTEKKLFSFDEYKNEGEMLLDWCAWVMDKNPSILVGHNIVSYDLPFLDQCAANNDINLILGRNGSELKFETYPSKFRKDQTQFLEYHKPIVYGREVIDTYFLSIKKDVTEKKYESYGLKYIIKKEGLEQEGRVFYDAGLIRNNIDNPEELVKIKQYCIDDAQDALNLYDKVIPPFFYLTPHIPKSYQAVIESATGSQINSVLVRSYLQQGHSIPKATEIQHFQGAISHGIPGIHKNVLSFDVRSLYPSIMLQYEVHPKGKDPERNFLKMLNYFTEERLNNKKKFKETKDEYFEHLSNSQKIFINSSYGALGASGLNFNSLYDADFVTRKGRDILQIAIQWATGKPYKDWKKENIKEEEAEDEEKKVF